MQPPGKCVLPTLCDDLPFVCNDLNCTRILQEENAQYSDHVLVDAKLLLCVEAVADVKVGLKLRLVETPLNPMNGFGHVLVSSHNVE